MGEAEEEDTDEAAVQAATEAEEDEDNSKRIHNSHIIRQQANIHCHRQKKGPAGGFLQYQGYPYV